jgi:excisionase family DNA binding protein
MENAERRSEVLAQLFKLAKEYCDIIGENSITFSFAPHVPGSNQIPAIDQTPKDLMSEEQENDEVFTIDEVANFLHCQRQTIYGLTSRRRIPFTKPPGTKKLLFLKSEVLAWLKESARKPISTK